MTVDFVLTFFYGFSAIFVEAGSKFGGKWGKRNRFWQQLSGLSKAILVVEREGLPGGNRFSGRIILRLPPRGRL